MDMSDSETEFDETVDATGAACPGPLMDLIGAIRRAESGTVVRLLSDNEQTLSDVPEWAEQTGNTVLETIDRGDSYAFYVEKS
jgi:TusA-related sulfurtransferase